MKIRSLGYQDEPGGTSIHRFEVGDYETWFRLPSDQPLGSAGDAMAVAALLPAMIRSEAIELPAALPVDHHLLANLDILQEIFLAWQGALGLDLKRVAINAEVVSSGEAASS